MMLAIQVLARGTADFWACAGLSVCWFVGSHVDSTHNFWRKSLK
jgi:hypothetical protein